MSWMGVGFFLGILQTGNSAGSARPLLASSLGSAQSRGGSSSAALPGPSAQPTRRTSCARSPAGPGTLASAHALPGLGRPPCALPTAQLQPQAGESAAATATALGDAARTRPGEGLEGEGRAGKWASPAPTGAAALPRRFADSQWGLASAADDAEIRHERRGALALGAGLNGGSPGALCWLAGSRWMLEEVLARRSSCLCMGLLGLFISTLLPWAGSF